MAGPVVTDPTRSTRRIPEFGTASAADVPPFIGVMSVLHREPTSSAFARLLSGSPRDEDAVSLAHVFEEISTLALHGLIAEDLLFDAFAFDSYWEQLRDSVETARKASRNPKFCENFEIAAGLAEAYRESRPPKPRVQR